MDIVGSVVTMETNIISIERTLQKLKTLKSADWVSMFVFHNIHMCMKTFDSKSFREVVNNADMVIPDGRPIYWLQKLLGHHKDAQRVRGQDIMNAICDLSNKSDLRIGLYGGSSADVLEQVIAMQYPLNKIVYSYSHPGIPSCR